MTLSNEVIDSFLSCRHKAYLKLNEIHRNKTDYELINNELYKNNKERFIKRIKLSYKNEQIDYSTNVIGISADRYQRLLVSPQGKGEDFLITFDAFIPPGMPLHKKRWVIFPSLSHQKKRLHNMTRYH